MYIHNTKKYKLDNVQFRDIRKRAVAAARVRKEMCRCTEDKTNIVQDRSGLNDRLMQFRISLVQLNRSAVILLLLARWWGDIIRDGW